MKNKIIHHCKYSDKILVLTPEEHDIAHEIELTAVTPLFCQTNIAILKKNRRFKKTTSFNKILSFK